MSGARAYRSRRLTASRSYSYSYSYSYSRSSDQTRPRPRCRTTEARLGRRWRRSGDDSVRWVRSTPSENAPSDALLGHHPALWRQTFTTRLRAHPLACPPRRLAVVFNYH